MKKFRALATQFAQSSQFVYCCFAILIAICCIMSFHDMQAETARPGAIQPADYSADWATCSEEQGQTVIQLGWIMADQAIKRAEPDLPRLADKHDELRKLAVGTWLKHVPPAKIDDERFLEAVGPRIVADFASGMACVAYDQ